MASDNFNIQELLSLLMKAIKELSSASSIFKEVGKDLSTSKIDKAQRLIAGGRDKVNKQERYLEAIKTAIEDLRADGRKEDKGLLNELKEELAKGNKELREMTGTRNFGERIGDMVSSMQNFTQTADTIAGAINRWIEFNTQMQIMQITAIQTGWENISNGQTPYMSKTMSILSNYQKENLNISQEQSRATIGLISKIVGGVIGGTVGGFASGGLGVGIGAGVGTGLATSIMDAVFTMQIANEKEIMNNVNKYTQTFGMMNELQNNVRLQKIGISGYLSSSGVSSSDGDVRGIRDAILKQSTQYAGIEGFGQDQIASSLQAIGMTKQFGGVDQMQMQKDMKLAGMTTGLGEQSVMAFVTEMSIRTKAPLDRVMETFGKLTDVSDKLKMPLQQVMEDFKTLTISNQKYGFSQEVLLGLYSSFADEIKKGTMSVADFQKVLQGMSQTPTDKATGIGALLKGTSLSTILSGTPDSDKAGVSALHNLISGMDTQDIGAFLKMASSPDAKRNIFQDQILDKYNLGQSDLESMQPNVMKSLLGLSTGYGKQGSGGLGQIIMEAFGGTVGLNMSSGYYEQGLEREQINKLGTRGDFDASKFSGAMGEKDAYLQSNVSPWLKKDLEAYQKYIPHIDAFNREFAETGDLFKSFDKILPELSKTMDEINNIITGKLHEIVEAERKRIGKTWVESYYDFMNPIVGGVLDVTNKLNIGNQFSKEQNVKVEVKASDEMLKVFTKFGDSMDGNN